MTDTTPMPLGSTVCTLHRGRTPLLVSLPHVGTQIPPDQQPRYVPRALETEDTDWYLDKLYAFVTELGASLLVPRYNRYLIDLNRPPENTPMYEGTNNTELCPTRFFTGEPLYRAGQAPDDAEIQRRVRTHWQPYHATLRGELDRLKAEHGYVLLYDGHSIQSQLPWLFEGTLPDLNLGTADGEACAPELRDALAGVLAAQTRYSHVVDGRFKGGYITRHYGQPQHGVHAVQMEKCWRTYMPESLPTRWDDTIAQQVQPLLRQLLQTMLAWKPQ
jgi:N-formylglutamate deformylase